MQPKNGMQQTYIQVHPDTTLEPQNQEMGKFYVVQERRATNSEAQKL